MSPSIFHSSGSLTGYFGSSGRIADALAGQLRPVSACKTWNSRNSVSLNEGGFQRASDIRGGNHPHNAVRQKNSSYLVRYITCQGTPRRELPPAKFETFICQSLPDLQNIGTFSGLTIIEDAVLISCLRDDGPDMIGTFLREMANRTGGIIVLGSTWIPPVSGMDPYFDRVVSVYEIPMTILKNKRVKPDYGQTMIQED